MDDGGFTIDMTKPGAKEYFHLAQLKGAIRLEGLGMRHSSGRSALKHAKDLYAFTGNREKVLSQIVARMQAILEGRLDGALPRVPPTREDIADAQADGRDSRWMKEHPEGF